MCLNKWHIIKNVDFNSTNLKNTIKLFFIGVAKFPYTDCEYKFKLY